jgi:hypothetical protein
MAYIPFEKVDHNLINSFQQYLLNKGAKKSSINTYVVLLKAIIEDAYTDDLVRPLKKRLTVSLKPEVVNKPKLSQDEITAQTCFRLL